MILCIVLTFRDNKSKSSGNVSIIVKDISGETVSSKLYEYNKGDSLFDILDDNFNLEYKETVYGHYLLSVDDIKTDGLNTWLWLEVGYLKDGKKFSEDIDLDDYDVSDSSYGIDKIELKNHMILGISKRDSSHSTSIVGSDIDISSNKNNIGILKIISYVLFSAFLIGIIVYSIIRHKDEKLTIKKMCILSLMAVILFVQEEALTMLPNIQLTFMLISVYAAIFGIRNTSIIVLIHIILDNMVMGSLNPIVMVPMFIGYIILVVLMYLVKDTKLYIKVIVASISALIYCYLFLITNAIFLEIDIKAYFIADIPFEALLVLSTVFTMTYLYKPVYKAVNDGWNDEYIEVDEREL